MSDFLSQVREDAEVKRALMDFLLSRVGHQDPADRAAAHVAYDCALVRAALKLAAARVLANDPKGACSNHQQGVRDAASLVAGLAEEAP